MPVPENLKEPTMYSKNILVAAAALAVLSAAGLVPASAAPWNHPRHEAMHRHYVERARIQSALRFHHYRVVGAPYFLRGHYVVRTHDRRGRPVIVEVNPYTGAFIGEFRI
jgi:hypothetical protein